MSKKNRNREVSTSAPVIVSDAPAVAEVSTPVAPVSAAPAEKPALKYPRENGKCWLVWKHCDAVLEANKVAPSVKDVRTHAEMQGWNLSNASQEFYRWKKFRQLPR